MGYKVDTGHYDLICKLLKYNKAVDTKLEDLDEESIQDIKDTLYCQMKEMHDYIDPHWVGSLEIYHKKWVSGGKTRINLRNLCSFIHYKELSTLLSQINNLSDYDPKDEIHMHVKYMKKDMERFDTQDIRAMSHCWEQLLQFGQSYRVLNTMILTFEREQKKSKEFNDLLIRIGTLWPEYSASLCGRNTWQALESWLKNCIFIPSITRRESIISNKNVQYIFELDISNWVGLYTSYNYHDRNYSKFASK